RRVRADLAERGEPADRDAVAPRADGLELRERREVEEAPARERAGVEVDEEIGAPGERGQALSGERIVQRRERRRERARPDQLERRERRSHPRVRARRAEVATRSRRPAALRDPARTRRAEERPPRAPCAAARTASTIFW